MMSYAQPRREFYWCKNDVFEYRNYNCLYYSMYKGQEFHLPEVELMFYIVYILCCCFIDALNEVLSNIKAGTEPEMKPYFKRT